MKCAGLLLVLGAALLLAASSFAQGECTDSVWAEVDGTTVTVHHDQATYNCCSSIVFYSVQGADNQVYVDEVETGGYCFCICCVDLLVEFEDFAPGTYNVQLRWDDYETGELQLVVVEVVVPDQGQPGTTTMAGWERSDCYDPPVGVLPPPEFRTWGWIKALYQ